MATIFCDQINGIKCPYTISPKGIVVHNTANDASTQSEVGEWKKNQIGYWY